MLKLISFEQAAEILEAQPVSRKKEYVAIEDALGRVLAENMTAAFPMPPFDKSPFDGFAFRAEDTPGELKIRGESAAGSKELEPLLPGTAMRIFTGAPVPDGADVIMKFEDTEVTGGTVRIAAAQKAGTSIIRQGEDYPAGAVLAMEGERLVPATVGVLASQGFGQIPVYCRPKVLFISTGTELAEPGEERARYGIYNSSYYSLSGYLRMMNFTVRRGGDVPDDQALIASQIEAGLNGDTDLVITTGGASVGDYDFAVRAAEALGMEILFWKVNAKPGGALMAARRGEKLLISLSGNPAAAMMSLLVVLQPYLRKLTGVRLGNKALELPLLNDMPKFSTAVRMLRGHPTIRDGITYFEENPGRGNGHIASFEQCSMIGIVPAGSGNLPAGTVIRVLQLPVDLY
ncbi:MAG: molybdopterin molybdotransferase MoeA [Oscillospiraceae bacterium]|nr:molybdopterin molybdotransferase MoeA [Oscillospiraceae bacterium]